jgi:hypothetical protein
MNELVGLVENVCAEVGQAVELWPAVGQVLEEDPDIVILVLARVAACSRAEQHHALEPRAVHLIESSAEASEDGIVGWSHFSIEFGRDRAGSRAASPILA